MFDVIQLTMGYGIRPSGMYINKLKNSDNVIKAFYGVFLIKNDKYNILVDTGIEPYMYASLCGREIQEYISIEEALKKINLSIEDISFVIQTHLHFDHAGNLSIFSDKKIYVQKMNLNMLKIQKIKNYFINLFILGFHLKLLMEIKN